MNKEKIKNMLKEKNIKYDYKYHAFKISEQYNLNYNDIVQLMEFTDNNEYFNMGFQKLLIGLHIKDVIEFVFVTRTLNECQTHTEINKALAEYFNIDPTVVRLLWIFLVLCAGTGVLAYFVAAIIMPYKSEI